MHKYQPRIHLLKNPEEQENKTDITRAETFVFPETTFMAVTSYQNHLVSLQCICSWEKERIMCHKDNQRATGPKTDHGTQNAQAARKNEA